MALDDDLLLAQAHRLLYRMLFNMAVDAGPAMFDLTFAHGDLFFHNRNSRPLLVRYTSAVPCLLPTYVGCGLRYSIGSHADPALLLPLGGTLVDMSRGHALHNFQATIRLLITSIDHDQRASPAHSLRIGAGLVLRHAKVC
jgi:hypothetical protein